MTLAEAPDAIRRLVVLAGQVLRHDPGQHPPKSQSALVSCLQRVARLRNELHVTANSVARFSYDEHPLLAPVRTTAPTASNAVLAPTHVLFQLDLTAARLIEHLGALSAVDWMRTGRIDDWLVTLGDLIEGVVHSSTHDLLDLQHAMSTIPSERVAVLDDGRTAEIVARRPRSRMPKEPRHVAAS